MKIGSLVQLIVEQDAAGKRLCPLDMSEYYTVSYICDGKFFDGWHPCLYLEETGWVYAFRKSIFKEVQPPFDVNEYVKETKTVTPWKV